MSDALIVALDFESKQEAVALVAALGDEAGHYKIGLQMLTVAGPDFVRELIAQGKQVFLDLKLHEIPNSVAGAVAAARVRGGLGGVQGGAVAWTTRQDNQLRQ